MRLHRVEDVEVGIVVRWRDLPWRVESIDPVPPDLWTDAETEAAGRGGLPFRLVLEPVPDGPWARYTAGFEFTNQGWIVLRGSSFSGPWHDWEVLDWPRAPVCAECGLLWPCPDQRVIDDMARAIADATAPRCDRCGRHLRGRMQAVIDGDGTPDGPGRLLFCGKKGACLTAARRAADERGMMLTRMCDGCSWKAVPK